MGNCHTYPHFFLLCKLTYIRPEVNRHLLMCLIKASLEQRKALVGAIPLVNTFLKKALPHLLKKVPQRGQGLGGTMTR
jgi:hypothetical protein